MKSKNTKKTSSDDVQTLFAIDASIYIFQSYFAFPESFFSQSERSVNAVYGYTTWLLKFLLNVRPRYISACFDESLTTGFRHSIDPDYKSNRVLPDEALSYQLLACKKITELLGVPCYGSHTHEADDFIASSVRLAQRLGLSSCIVSRDKDLAQMLRLDADFEIEGVAKKSILSTNKTSSITMWHYPNEAKISAVDFYHKHQINPEFMADFLAIIGDRSDAIEGVPGVGAKTVAQLFQYFPGWRALKENLNNISSLPIRGALRLQGLLQSNIDLIDKNMRLTTLVDNLFSQDALSEKQAYPLLSRVCANKEALFLLFDEFNFPKKMYSDLDKDIEISNEINNREHKENY